MRGVVFGLDRPRLCGERPPGPGRGRVGAGDRAATGDHGPIYVAGREAFSRRVGLVAAWCFALWFPAAWHTQWLLTETTTDLLMAAVLALLALTLVRRSARVAGLTGVTLGVIGISHSAYQFLPWVMVVTMALWAAFGHGRARLVAALSLGVASVLLPFALAVTAAGQPHLGEGGRGYGGGGGWNFPGSVAGLPRTSRLFRTTFCSATSRIAANSSESAERLAGDKSMSNHISEPRHRAPPSVRASRSGNPGGRRLLPRRACESPRAPRCLAAQALAQCRDAVCGSSPSRAHRVFRRSRLQLWKRPHTGRVVPQTLAPCWLASVSCHALRCGGNRTHAR